MARDRERPSKDEPTELVIPHDVIGEQVVLAATVVDWNGIGAELLDRHHPDVFVEERHRILWAAFRAMRARRIEFDWGILQRQLGTDRESRAYMEDLVERMPDVPDTIAQHVENLLWDRRRIQLATTHIPPLLEALQNPSEEQDRVRALAMHVGEWGKARGSSLSQWVHDPEEIVRESMAEIRKRVAGHASSPYGIRGLDTDLDTGKRRMIPGAAAGQITVLTGISGSGKSTMAAQLTLSIARQQRRVAYGAWEMKGPMTLELLACISLGWSRSRLMQGAQENEVAEGEDPTYLALYSEEDLQVLQARMQEIAEYVTFFRNPFRRNRGDRKNASDANDRNLDLLQELVADSGCEVVVCDLWKRCLRDASVEAEEDALMRQQAMAEELSVHFILLQQQRLKDIEQRPDKRPTREGIKGSSAWVEIADTIIGMHRPAQWKRIDDDKIEALILKQRYGKWPLAVEFEWDGDLGSITGGRTIDYQPPDMDGFGGESRVAGKMNAPRKSKWK